MGRGRQSGRRGWCLALDVGIGQLEFGGAQVSTAHVANGAHLLADLHGVARRLLCDAAALEALLVDAAAAAGAQVLFAHFHGFGDGGGVTGVLLLAESHISIHTWPEHSFAAVDIFMCGGALPERALQVIEQGLDAAGCVRRSVPRGIADPADQANQPRPPAKDTSSPRCDRAPRSRRVRAVREA